MCTQLCALTWFATTFRRQLPPTPGFVDSPTQEPEQSPPIQQKPPTEKQSDTGMPLMLCYSSLSAKIYTGDL